MVSKLNRVGRISRTGVRHVDCKIGCLYPKLGFFYVGFELHIVFSTVLHYTLWRIICQTCFYQWSNCNFSESLKLPSMLLRHVYQFSVSSNPWYLY